VGDRAATGPAGQAGSLIGLSTTMPEHDLAAIPGQASHKFRVLQFA
jgi:hypothetical protein